MMLRLLLSLKMLNTLGFLKFSIVLSSAKSGDLWQQVVTYGNDSLRLDGLMLARLQNCTWLPLLPPLLLLPVSVPVPVPLLLLLLPRNSLILLLLSLSPGTELSVFVITFFNTNTRKIGRKEPSCRFKSTLSLENLERVGDSQRVFLAYFLCDLWLGRQLSEPQT
jgi:hypothetical protein